MLKGRMVKLTWADVLELILKEHGAERSDVWYVGGFRPVEDETKDFIRLDIPEDHPFSETCGCRLCLQKVRTGQEK